MRAKEFQMPNSLEKAAEKAMGTVKGAKATLKGLSGVFKKLMQEHGEVSALMKRVSMSGEESVRAELYPTIRKELLSHEKGELKAVYPVLAQYAATSEIADTHAREASELDAAIQALDALEFSGEEWAPAFEHLFGLVKRHVAEEEGDFFPKAQETIGDAQAKAIEGRYEAAKKSALAEVS
jgi:thioredoxin-like negative regulator of GroEL